MRKKIQNGRQSYSPVANGAESLVATFNRRNASLMYRAQLISMVTNRYAAAWACCSVVRLVMFDKEIAPCS